MPKYSKLFTVLILGLIGFIQDAFAIQNDGDSHISGVIKVQQHLEHNLDMNTIKPL